MSASATLKAILLGEDRSLSKTLDHAGKAADDTGHKMGSFAGVAAKSLAAVGVAEFAKKSIDAFGQVAGESAKVMRYIGGTAEDASRLRFAAQESGVGIDTLTGGLGKMSKSMAGGGKAFKALGIDVLDSHGKLRDVNEVFLETSDRLSKMPAGAAKTSAILAIFGKTGMALGPMLNKGAEGIKELEKQSDKLGLTMSSKDIKATKENVMAKREFKAAIEGVQVSLGRALYPVLTLVATQLAGLATKIGPLLVPMFQLLANVIKQVVSVVSTLMPIVTALANWAAKHPAQLKAVVIALVLVVGAIKAMKAVSGAMDMAQNIGRTVTAMREWGLVTKVQTAAQWLLDAALDANPIGLIVIAIAALVVGLVIAYNKSETFRAIVVGAFNAVKNVAVGVFNWIKANWPLLLIIITGPIGLAVKLIMANWNTIMAGGRAVVSWFMTAWHAVYAYLTWPFTYGLTIIRQCWSLVSGGAGAVIGWLTTAWHNVYTLVVWPFTYGYTVITGTFGKIVTFITGMPAKIGRAASGMFNGIRDAFKEAINYIIAGWNNLSFSLPGLDTHTPLGKIGGWTLNTPNIPYMAAGGPVTARMPYIVGENRPELFVPNQSGTIHPDLSALSGRGGGGSTNIQVTVNVPPSADPLAVGRSVASVLEKYIGAGGRMRIAQGIIR